LSATARLPLVRFDEDGICVESGLLWLDATTPKAFGVISHAHADHVGRHATILATPETAALVRKRGGDGPGFLVRAYRERTVVGDLVVTLLPAGHILGSAMVYVEGPGGSLLYTGDVRPGGGLTCPPAEPVRADVLVTEATFGRSDHRLPPAEAARADLVRFARDTLADGATPVFLAYSLGKAQEVMTALAQADVRVAAHGAVWNLCNVYRDFGLRFPGARRLSGKRSGGKRAAIVVPPRWRNSPEVRRAAPLRVAAVTGWGDRAIGPGVDRAIPLSDHADFDGLLEIVDAVGPRKVFVLHGYAAEFAATLRERGYDAEAVPGHSGPDEDERPGMFG